MCLPNLFHTLPDCNNVESRRTTVLKQMQKYLGQKEYQTKWISMFRPG